ncbi:hypothetical protein Hanom_Chr09g00867251 [Helianthus anomalus]
MKNALCEHCFDGSEYSCGYGWHCSFPDVSRSIYKKSQNKIFILKKSTVSINRSTNLDSLPLKSTALNEIQPNLSTNANHRYLQQQYQPEDSFCSFRKTYTVRTMQATALC